jgi:integrase
MRMREIYTLEHEQIKIDKRTIFLEKTKNGDRRQVPLSTIAIKSLNQYFRESFQNNIRRDNLLLPFWDGDNTTRKLAKVTSKLSKQWKRIFDHAGCINMNFHDLRHEATSRYYERTNLSDLQIARITGHKNLEMLKRYANLRASDLARQLW